MSLNETIRVFVDTTMEHTISCAGGDPNMIWLYLFAIIGFLSIITTMFKAGGEVIFMPLVYVFAIIKWSYKRIRKKK